MPAHARGQLVRGDRTFWGGLTLPTLSSDERRRRVPFLTVLGERPSERASERERERERKRERARESERGTQGGSGVWRVVAHRTLSQVRPAHHTVILESSNPCSVAPSTLAHAARMSHMRSSIAHPMPTTRALQAYAHTPRFLRPGRPPAAAAPGGNPAMQASTRPRPHPARADTAHTPMHATRNRPTRARARRRSMRPPGTEQSRAQLR